MTFQEFQNLPIHEIRRLVVKQIYSSPIEPDRVVDGARMLGVKFQDDFDEVWSKMDLKNKQEFAEYLFDVIVARVLKDDGKLN